MTSRSPSASRSANAAVWKTVTRLLWKKATPVPENDGVAPVERVLANKPLLPETTRWIAIEGGNHSQFGHYGHQLFDGRATITRESQQAATRQTLLTALATPQE